MVVELAELIETFLGTSNQTWCFNHIINLIAKTILRQFDIQKNRAESALNDAEQELRNLAEGADIEELVTAVEQSAEDKDEDDMDGWVDERATLDKNECEQLDKSTRPVKLVLVKVATFSLLRQLCDSHVLLQLCKLVYSILHSTTIILPRWYDILEKLKIGCQIMPRDVATWWNSTFNMLAFAREYQKAIDAICGDKAMGLRRYELSEAEWKITGQLCDVLEVRCTCLGCFHADIHIRSSRMRPSSSPMPHQISQWSSRRWTILTRY
jgi:hypothetical protein